MTEMVEPDRTILIISIIGLVIIWGSFFYHKFVQAGSTAEPADAAEAGETEGDAGSVADEPAAQDSGPQGPATKSSRRRGKKRKR